MRLREIEKIIELNLPVIKASIKPAVSGNEYYKFENYISVYKSINNLRKIGHIENEYEQLVQKELITIGELDNLKIIGTRFNFLMSILRDINKKSSAIQDIINNHFKEPESESSLIVFVPSNMEFNSFSDSIKLLNKFFDLISDEKDYNKSNLQVKNFDVGTNWIEILTNPNFIILIGLLLSASQSLYQQIQTNKLIMKQAESTEMDQKFMEDYKKNIMNIQLNLCDNLARKIVEEQDLNKSNEFLEQYKKAILIGTDLLEKGISFEPSINASIEVLKSFPTTNAIELLETTSKKAIAGIKTITSSNPESEEND